MDYPIITNYTTFKLENEGVTIKYDDLNDRTIIIHYGHTILIPNKDLPNFIILVETFIKKYNELNPPF